MFPDWIKNRALVLLLAALFPSVANCDESSIDWEAAREFWSFKAPRSSALPQIQRSDWPQNRVDHFILAELEKGIGNLPQEEKVRIWLPNQIILILFMEEVMEGC